MRSPCLDCTYYAVGAPTCGYYIDLRVPITFCECSGFVPVPGRLWAHLVAQHAVVISPETPLDELRAMHHTEHKGPGTIRNHPVTDRDYTLAGIGKVLVEDEG